MTLDLFGILLHLTLSRSSSVVKVIGQSSRSKEEKRWKNVAKVVSVILIEGFSSCRVIKPHCRPSSMVCLSVCHSREPCRNSWTDQDAIWVEDTVGPREPCIRWRSRSPVGRENFKGEMGRPVWSIATLPWAVQKQLNWSRCHLGFGLRHSQGSIC